MNQAIQFNGKDLALQAFAKPMPLSMNRNEDRSRVSTVRPAATQTAETAESYAQALMDLVKKNIDVRTIMSFIVGVPATEALMVSKAIYDYYNGDISYDELWNSLYVAAKNIVITYACAQFAVTVMRSLQPGYVAGSSKFETAIDGISSMSCHALFNKLAE